uniref:Reverse transcriptase domain-containing protein n=1 Tax=Nicotiana tabacum TaxID=4097 RepID=A0A1S4BAE4_TOBAC|nr:PREDICTED: uncharacterized protein LOC107806228 [Nicotiana tabacum]
MPAQQFPQNMKQEKLEKYFGRFLEMLKKLYVNIPFTEVLAQMPTYANFLKEILSRKRKLEETTTVKLNAHSSSILQNKIPQKCGDPGSFTIPCSLGSKNFDNALCDSGASINQMPLSVFRKLEDEEDDEIPSDEASAYSCFKLDVVGELAKNYKFDKFVGDTLERCITQSSTVEDEDPEINKEAEALETEDQVVDEEKLKKEASKPDVELKLVELLKKHKKAIGWSIADIQGISPAICMHKILFEENNNPVWISPVQVVPKKGDITVVKNEDNELIPTRTVTGWRMCIDYRRLNDATRKDHFLLPFIDQMLKKVDGQGCYCFLDGYSGYNQIPIDLEDIEKTTFTCPSCIFAYRRMPFWLCNVLSTFQRGNCLRPQVNAHRIEVDIAKVDVIARLPLPTSMKSIRSFLGYAGFYRRFIKNVSSIAKPLTALLVKYVKFVFNVECLRAFELIKERLISSPIMVTSD